MKRPASLEERAGYAILDEAPSEKAPACILAISHMVETFAAAYFPTLCHAVLLIRAGTVAAATLLVSRCVEFFTASAV